MVGWCVTVDLGEIVGFGVFVGGLLGVNLGTRDIILEGNKLKTICT